MEMAFLTTVLVCELPYLHTFRQAKSACGQGRSTNSLSITFVILKEINFCRRLHSNPQPLVDSPWSYH